MDDHDSLLIFCWLINNIILCFKYALLNDIIYLFIQLLWKSYKSTHEKIILKNYKLFGNSSVTSFQIVYSVLMVCILSANIYNFAIQLQFRSMLFVGGLMVHD